MCLFQRHHESSKTRGELSRIATSLKRVEALRSQVSLDATRLLELTSEDPTSNASHALSAAIAECKRARILVERAQLKPKRSAALILAYGVAGVLAGIKQPLSVGRDGLLHRVLAEVWYALEPERVPLDLLAYVREAARHGRQLEPNFNPRKGRPRKK